MSSQAIATYQNLLMMLLQRHSKTFLCFRVDCLEYFRS